MEKHQDESYSDKGELMGEGANKNKTQMSTRAHGISRVCIIIRSS